MRRQDEAKIRYALPAALLFASATFFACMYGTHLERDGELAGWIKAAYRPVIIAFGLVLLVAYGTAWSNWRDNWRSRSRTGGGGESGAENGTASKKKKRKIRFLVALDIESGVSPNEARKELLTRINGEAAYLPNAAAIQVRKVKRTRRVFRYVFIVSAIIFLALWLSVCSLG